MVKHQLSGLGPQLRGTDGARTGVWTLRLPGRDPAASLALGSAFHKPGPLPPGPYGPVPPWKRGPKPGLWIWAVPGSESKEGMVCHITCAELSRSTEGPRGPAT